MTPETENRREELARALWETWTGEESDVPWTDLGAVEQGFYREQAGKLIARGVFIMPPWPSPTADQVAKVRALLDSGTVFHAGPLETELERLYSQRPRLSERAEELVRLVQSTYADDDHPAVAFRLEGEWAPPDPPAKTVRPRHLSPHAEFGDDPSGWCGCAGCDPRPDCGCPSCLTAGDPPD